jgi:hypothetical protein
MQRMKRGCDDSIVLASSRNCSRKRVTIVVCSDERWVALVLLLTGGRVGGTVSTQSRVDWLVGWLVGGLVGGLVGWWVGWLVG